VIADWSVRLLLTFFSWQIDDPSVQVEPSTNVFTVNFPAATGTNGFPAKGKFEFYKRAAAGGTDPKKACSSQGGVLVGSAEINLVSTNTPNGTPITGSNPARNRHFQQFKFGTILGSSTIFVQGTSPGTGQFHVCCKFSLLCKNSNKNEDNLMGSREFAISVFVQCEGTFSGSNAIKVKSLTPQGETQYQEIKYTCHAALCPGALGIDANHPLHQVGGLGDYGDAAVPICFYSDQFSTSGVKIVGVKDLLLSDIDQVGGSTVTRTQQVLKAGIPPAGSESFVNAVSLACTDGGIKDGSCVRHYVMVWALFLDPTLNTVYVTGTCDLQFPTGSRALQEVGKLGRSLQSSVEGQLSGTITFSPLVLPASSEKSSNTIVIASAAAGVGVLAMVALALFLTKKHATKDTTTKLPPIEV
jgi:hypothetical protein